MKLGQHAGEEGPGARGGGEGLQETVKINWRGNSAVETGGQSGLVRPGLEFWAGGGVVVVGDKSSVRCPSGGQIMS